MNQRTDMSCWAASAAMVVGWRDRICLDPAAIAAGTGDWAGYANDRINAYQVCRGAPFGAMAGER